MVLYEGACASEKSTYWAGDGVRIQFFLGLWWTSHLCRTSREASWVGKLCTCHLGAVVGCLGKKLKKN